jgi:signal transduction histidine kinase/ligand-binding sensor domain-containing protein
MGGISRFDGVRFVNFDLEGNAGRGPVSVNRLFVDAAGRLWVNSFSGVERYAEGKFVPEFQREELRLNALLRSDAHEVVFMISPARPLRGTTSPAHLLRGKLGEAGKWSWDFVSLPDAMPDPRCQQDRAGGIWYLRSDRTLGRWANGAFERIALEADLPGHQPRALAIDDDGRLWVGTNRGIALRERDRFIGMTPTDGEPEFTAIWIHRGIGGAMWVAAGGKIRLASERRWVAEAQGLDSSPDSWTRLGWPRPDGHGGLWFTHLDWGLVHIDAKGRMDRISLSDGLPSHRIRCLFTDREGNAWTGYDRGALVRIRPRVFQTIARSEGLADVVVSSVCEDAEGNIWIGTVGGTVARWRDGRCTNFTVPKRGRICQNVVLCPDRQGRLWVGTEGSGVFIHERGEFTPVPLDLGQDTVRVILADQGGRVWVGTAYTLHCLQDDRWSVIHRFTTETGGLLASMAETEDGAIWLGTDGGSLLRYNGRGFDVVPWPAEASRSRFWTLWPTGQAGLWVGTYASGLWRYQAGRFGQHDHLLGATGRPRVTAGLTDAGGNLWMGTPAGIQRVPQSALETTGPDHDRLPWPRIYGRDDGLLTIGTTVEYQPRCWKGRDGRLWFGMTNGVAYVDPKDIRPNSVPPAVVLEEVRVDGLPVPRKSRAGDADVAAVELDPSRHELEIRFTAPSMVASEAVQIRYRLRGLDDKWTVAGRQRTALYRALPPGEYVFEVKAANCDGVPSRNTATLAVVALPHFWQTRWFVPGLIIASAGVAGGSATLALRRRYRRRMERAAQERALEMERARISRDLHDELGAGLTQIGLLGDLVARDPDKRFTGEISARARELAAALDEIVWAINPAKDTPEALSDYFIRYAQTLLQSAGLRCRLAVGTGEGEGGLNAEIRHQLFLAFKEALNNVITHARATEVHIGIELAAGQWRIRVVDNGVGLAEAAARGSPDGIAGMRERLARLGGRCEIKGAPEQGTSVTFLLPVKAKIRR